ncbi:MAG TPA: histidine kinase dimerization/phospho-acceptor domain-containing protein [Thermoanaerobaculia bacterium]|nr:histidine kinase dimerization/phospho-acceptor domain-containing protein [Thermoanaerobaculia bacterium]
MDSWLDHFAHTAFRRSSDTAHDLKTPLNVAVLNVELLRMRIAKIAGAAADDEKILAYTRSIETELRRMARIFDTFFLLSTPPKGDEEPASVDLVAACAEACASTGCELALPDGSAKIVAHDARIRESYKLFLEGASKALKTEGRGFAAELDSRQFAVTVSGEPTAEDFEATKIFKFYYSDPLGNPDLSLAAARLIAETYGGGLIAEQDRDKVVFRLSFPLGDR